MIKIYLVRHGENKANITKEFSCKVIDYPLTPKGKIQAQQTAEYFADKDIHEIYASPLKRATETAQAIGTLLNLPVTVMETFREINVGTLETEPVTVENWMLYKQIIEDWISGKVETAFPNGENYITLLERMKTGVKQIVADKTNRNIVIVGHGGIFTCTLNDLCQNVDINQLFTQLIHNCAVTEIVVELQNNQITGELIQWAYSDHMHGEAADFVLGVLRDGDELPDLTGFKNLSGLRTEE